MFHIKILLNRNALGSVNYSSGSKEGEGMWIAATISWKTVPKVHFYTILRAVTIPLPLSYYGGKSTISHDTPHLIWLCPCKVEVLYF